MLRLVLLTGVLPLVLAMVASAAEQAARGPTSEEIRKMEEATPDKPLAPPKAARKVLVWGRMAAHDPNPYAAKAIEILGKKSGAFGAVVSEDPETLLPEKLGGFDALVMNNVHQPEPFLPDDLKSRAATEQEALKKRNEAIHKSILDFVSGGKGIVGIHAATAAFNSWPAYGEMMGGYYAGHITADVPLRIEETGHPLTAMFPKDFKILDEIYLFGEPYSRAKLRVLISLDLAKMQDPGKRPDKDYAVSWVREYGQGRVFYSTLGHVAQTYWNPTVLRHFLAGIQFALGDLKADAKPVAAGTR